MSNIAWTEQTWNPVIGCEKVSTGCLNCYAERMAGRLFRMGVAKERQRREAGIPPVADAVDAYTFVIDNDWGGYVGGWNGKTVLVESALDKPLKRKKPTTYFVCSMGDLFHESVEPDWIFAVMDVIERCPQHTFQILTKRADRMRMFFQHSWCDRGDDMPENLWLGVTAENQEQADARIPHLLATPAAAVRFISVEPMLSQVWMSNDWIDPLGSNAPKLDWVICGCESGPERRRMDHTWAIYLQEQCASAQVPFFMKQIGRHDGKLLKDMKTFPPQLQVREFPKKGGQK